MILHNNLYVNFFYNNNKKKQQRIKVKMIKFLIILFTSLTMNKQVFSSQNTEFKINDFNDEIGSGLICEPNNITISKTKYFWIEKKFIFEITLPEYEPKIKNVSVIDYQTKFLKFVIGKSSNKIKVSINRENLKMDGYVTEYQCQVKNKDQLLSPLKLEGEKAKNRNKI